MSKLQCVVNGQTIRFLPIAKVFGDLSTDLPSGAIKLENGEIAYWRLERDLKELRNHQRSMTPLLEGLAKGMERLVRSQPFLDHYGIKNPPKIDPQARLIGTLRNLVQLNLDRSNYITTYYGTGKSLVENIQVPLGNLVYFSAYRGLEKDITAKGMRGRIWMDHEFSNSFFDFVVISPVIKLGDFISPDRLAKEISTKLAQNFPHMVGKITIEFAGTHSDDYHQSRLAELVTKKSTVQNKNGKKAEKSGDVVEGKRGETKVATHIDELAHTRIHVVAEGESLSKIAHRYYANGKMWRALFVYNAKTIENPDLIYPKQEIKIPHRTSAERMMNEIDGLIVTSKADSHAGALADALAVASKQAVEMFDARESKTVKEVAAEMITQAEDELVEKIKSGELSPAAERSNAMPTTDFIAESLG